MIKSPGKHVANLAGVEPTTEAGKEDDQEEPQSQNIVYQ